MRSSPACGGCREQNPVIALGPGVKKTVETGRAFHPRSGPVDGLGDFANGLGRKPSRALPGLRAGWSSGAYRRGGDVQEWLERGLRARLRNVGADPEDLVAGCVTIIALDQSPSQAIPSNLDRGAGWVGRAKLRHRIIRLRENRSARHFIVIAWGSLGDVHPYVGLAVALQGRGHRVTFLTHPLLGEMVVDARAELSCHR